jgi:hypothetical protein
MYRNVPRTHLWNSVSEVKYLFRSQFIIYLVKKCPEILCNDKVYNNETGLPVVVYMRNKYYLLEFDTVLSGKNYEMLRRNLLPSSSRYKSSPSRRNSVLAA